MNTKHIIKAGRAMRIWGIVLTTLGVIYLLMALGGDYDMWVAMVVFGVPGVILLRRAKAKRKAAIQDIEAAAAVQAALAAQPEPKKRNISCPGCSANTVVAEGEVTECKFCMTQMTY